MEEDVFNQGLDRITVLRRELIKEWKMVQNEKTNLVNVKIEDGQNRIRVALESVAFYCRSNERLTENQIRKIMNVEMFCIALEKLV